MLASPPTPSVQAWTLEAWLQSYLEPRFEFENGMLNPQAYPTRKQHRIVGRLYWEMDRWTQEYQAGSGELEVEVALASV
ncbi:MAG: hypothetical protein P3X24_004110, partial [bacterium]|nr:hypothetical protein [bacterium]